MSGRHDDSGLRGTVGLGFRAALADALLKAEAPPLSFIEIAPENYLGVGGARGRHLAMARERWPVVCHGLCGDFSGAAPINEELTAALKGFLRAHGARWYSDHLCLTHVDGGESFELLPLPFSEEAAVRAAARVRALRDRLELPLAVENVSAYLRPSPPPGEQAMDEASFTRRVVEEADCGILLDVNNAYVNAVNFSSPTQVHEAVRAFIRALPLERVVQIHMAGHHVEATDDGGAPTLVVDTHGAPMIDPVYDLLAFTLDEFAARGLTPPPVLLERDHNIPPLGELVVELQRLRTIVGGAR